MENIEEFLQNYTTPAVKKLYGMRIRLFEEFAGVPIEKAQNADLCRYMQVLLAKVEDGEMSFNTLNSAYFAISAAYKWIYQEDPLAYEAVMRNAFYINNVNPLDFERMLSDEQIQEYFSAVSDDPLTFTASVLAYEAGLRTDEIRNLRCRDIDLTNRTLQVADRTIEVSEHVASALSQYKGRVTVSCDDYLFTTRRGTRFASMECFCVTIRKRQEKLGAPHVTLQSLRTRFLCDLIATSSLGDQKALQSFGEYTDVREAYIRRVSNSLYDQKARENVVRLPDAMRAIENALNCEKDRGRSANDAD